MYVEELQLTKTTGKSSENLERLRQAVDPARVAKEADTERALGGELGARTPSSRRRCCCRSTQLQLVQAEAGVDVYGKALRVLP